MQKTPFIEQKYNILGKPKNYTTTPLKQSCVCQILRKCYKDFWLYLNLKRINKPLRISLIIAIMYLSFYSLKAQHIDWQQTYGGDKLDVVSSVTNSKSGGYLVCGYSNSINGDIKRGFSGNDYWILKINEKGSILWEYKLGGSSDYDFAVDVHENNKGEIVVIGSSFSNDGQRKAKKIFGGDDIWIAAINKDGKLLWNKTYGGSLEDMPVSSYINKDESIVITGHTKSKDKHIKKLRGKQDVFVLKIKKKKGKIQWFQTYGGSKNDIGHSIVGTKDGGYILCGETESNDHDVLNKRDKYYDAWIVKLDKKGKIEWQKTIGGSKDDVARAIIQTPEGEYLFVGETESDDGHVEQNNGAYDCWIVKLGTTGRIRWQKTYGGAKVDYGTSVAIDYSTGNYLVLGATSSNDPHINQRKGSSDLWLISITSNGEIIKNTALGGKSMEEPKKIMIDKTGNILIAANTLSIDGDIDELQRYDESDVWLIKMVPENDLMQNTSTQERGICLTKSYAGGYFFAGINEYEKEESNIILSQYDPAGFEMFKKEIDANGADEPKAIIKASDGTGGYYLIGSSSSTNQEFKNNRGGKDIFFMKISGTGEVIYTKMMGGSNDDFAADIIKKNKEEFVIVGATRSTDKDIRHDHKGDKDIWVVTISKTGKIKWEKNYGGFNSETATKAILNGRKQIAIVGYSNSSDQDIEEAHGNKDGLFLLLGDTGQIERIKTYGDQGNDWFNDVTQTPDGGYVMVGATKSPKIEAGNKGGADFWIVRTNSNGDLIWEKTFGGLDNEEAHSIIKLSNTQYMVIGTSNSSNGDVKNAKGSSDGWFIVIDDNGKLINQKNIGSRGFEQINNAIHISGKKYIGIGRSRDDNYNSHIHLEEFKN